jgi:hypothetical protein
MTATSLLNHSTASRRGGPGMTQRNEGAQRKETRGMPMIQNRTTTCGSDQPSISKW